MNCEDMTPGILENATVDPIAHLPPRASTKDLWRATCVHPGIWGLISTLGYMMWAKLVKRDAYGWQFRPDHIYWTTGRLFARGMGAPLVAYYCQVALKMTVRSHNRLL